MTNGKIMLAYEHVRKNFGMLEWGENVSAIRARRQGGEMRKVFGSVCAFLFVAGILSVARAQD
ncbi:MAG: hypothetical protein ABIJ15_01880, partial [bacterium]